MTRTLAWTWAGMLLLAALAMPALAQQPGQGRGRGGGFFGGNSPVNLAGNEAVQKELGVGDAEKTKIEALRDEYREAIREELSAAGVDFSNFQNMSDEERRAAGEKMVAANQKVNEKFEPKLKEVLSADQLKRLQQIGWQASGAAALSDPVLVKELEITADQQSKLVEVNADFEKKQRALFAEGAEGDIQERFAKLRELNEERTKQATAVLTDKQREQFTSLKGKEFDVSQLRRGPGAGGGRPNRPKTE